MENTEKSPALVEQGRKGGKKLLEERGPEYFRELGRRGGKKSSQDTERMLRISRLGGINGSKDREEMRRRGKLGGQKVKELIARGKDAEKVEG